MSIERVESGVRKLLREKEELGEVGNCRNSVLEIAGYIRLTFSDAQINYLVYPAAKEGYGVHYSLLVRIGSFGLLVNAVHAPGFPVYIGDIANSVPTFFSMVETKEVI